jgi:hypothetical protein
MSWLFSRALVEEFSAGTSLDGKPYVQLSVMPTQQPFWRNDKTTESFDLSRFGLTSQLLTADHGEELLMSFLAAFHARTSAQPVRELASMASAVDYGRTSIASFAKYDRASCGWKTVQCSLLEDSDEFSGTWPRWGMMRNGASSERTMPTLRTSERGSGFWPTLTASIGKKCGGRHKGKSDTLASRLAEVEGLSTTSTGRVNPEWSEWLMGFPSGWSAIEPLGMHKFLEWQQQHSICSAADTAAAA